MSVVKLSVSLQENVAEGLRAAAKEEGTSVSGLTDTFVRQSLRQRALKKFFEEYEAEHGVITEEEMAEAEARAQRLQWD